MADQRGGGIAWTDITWNVVRGCSLVSEGCRNCYAMRQGLRMQAPGKPYHGLVRRRSNGEPQWTGKVELARDLLDAPMHWKRPRRIFVNAMSDLFHEVLTNEQIAGVFAVMALAPQHTFQILTKRAARMRDWFEWAAALWPKIIGPSTEDATPDANLVLSFGPPSPIYERRLEAVELTEAEPWPLPNVWLGVSCEDQQRADERIPLLLETPAAVRWISAEPLLGPIDLATPLRGVSSGFVVGANYVEQSSRPALDWVAVGGESGPGHRPLEVEWIRSIIEQCGAAAVPVFVKQDSGPRPGRQGRIPDELWLKRLPR